MYELSVERVFSAAHAITIKGRAEPVHGHDWNVTVVVAGDELDQDGLLCDFHLVERTLDSIIEPFHNRFLNESEHFARHNPTAEHVARHIAGALEPSLPTGVALVRVSVTEAPGCTATYWTRP